MPLQVENLTGNTQITYAAYHRVWPAAPRELLNVVHARQLNTPGRWLSTTFSCEHDSHPRNEDVRVRMDNKCWLLAKETHSAELNPSQPERKHMQTTCTYMADVNPGGWAQIAIVKSVAKKEFPKAMKLLTRSLVAHFKKEPVVV
jgi:collagen type IV alpha-3-binding protein